MTLVFRHRIFPFPLNPSAFFFLCLFIHGLYRVAHYYCVAYKANQAICRPVFVFVHD